MTPNPSVIKLTPEEYKQLASFNITYGRANTKFGDCLMALNEESFCFVHFGDTDAGIDELKETFPNANLSLNDGLIREKSHLFDSEQLDIKVTLKGTLFEMRVWEYLVHVPRGKTVFYEEVAKGIGKSKSVRAVAKAVAKNRIAYFVPCHRVIYKNLKLGNYKWGEDLKRKLLANEKQTAKRKFLDLFNNCRKKKLKEVAQEDREDK
ncbi:unnamed protein product [Phyllotreta striolata]|uniref:Methylated-DNA--protein-cysteine methyltransferase n=1 Tax=Phyllotreta striolata TaxID=444603 RepID=A0A9N9TND4_PHYSR|nr:unnamed protein product [Phyllotreta striolata]